MSKATSRSTTTPIDVTGLSYRYLGPGKVKVSLKTEAGKSVPYIISPAMLVESVNQAVDLRKTICWDSRARDWVVGDSENYRYLGAGKVGARFETETGESVSYVLSTATLMQSVRLAMKCINSNGLFWELIDDAPSALIARRCDHAAQ